MRSVVWERLATSSTVFLFIGVWTIGARGKLWGDRQLTRTCQAPPQQRATGSIERFSGALDSRIDHLQRWRRGAELVWPLPHILRCPRATVYELSATYLQPPRWPPGAAFEPSVAEIRSSNTDRNLNYVAGFSDRGFRQGSRVSPQTFRLLEVRRGRNCSSFGWPPWSPGPGPQELEHPRLQPLQLEGGRAGNPDPRGEFGLSGPFDRAVSGHGASSTRLRGGSARRGRLSRKLAVV